MRSGLITVAVVLGPGSVTVAFKPGALMGCTVPWALAAAAGVAWLIYLSAWQALQFLRP